VCKPHIGLHLAGDVTRGVMTEAIEGIITVSVFRLFAGLVFSSGHDICPVRQSSGHSDGLTSSKLRRMVDNHQCQWVTQAMRACRAFI